MSVMLLDMHYLLWRAFYAIGGLSHEGSPTGALFGVFRDIIQFQQIHQARPVFCFDGGSENRKELCPSYKADRGSIEDPMEAETIKAFLMQKNLMGKKYLRDIGFSNIFRQKGYEADDVIASLCQTLKEDVIIVSADADLYQLLAPHVVMWNPRTRKTTTRDSFIKEYGIPPQQWALVKAIAGCSSDNLPGVKGVGEITAVKYLKGALASTSKAYTSIVANQSVIDNNLSVTRLPFPGTKTFQLESDNVSRDKWRLVLESLGMKTLMREL